MSRNVPDYCEHSYTCRGHSHNKPHVPDKNDVITVAVETFFCAGRFQNRQRLQLCRTLSGTVRDAIRDVRDAIRGGQRHLVNNDFFVAILYVGDLPNTKWVKPELSAKTMVWVAMLRGFFKKNPNGC